MNYLTKKFHFLTQTLLLVVTFFLASFSGVLAQGATTDTVTLENPLEVNSIEDLLLAILKIVLILAVPIIIFFIIYSGFLYVTARGNAEQVSQASRALTYAIIGGVLVLGAIAITEIIRNLVGEF